MSSKLAWILPAMLLALGVMPFAALPDGDVPVSSYVWADACKGCHMEIYQAWSKTKHKTALYRLGEEQRQGACVKCHVTGSEEVLRRGESELNAGVQCEACHGPALAHAAAATDDLLPLVEELKRPDEKVCVKCHCDDSPHYQWFDYRSLHQFVHPVKTSP